MRTKILLLCILIVFGLTACSSKEVEVGDLVTINSARLINPNDIGDNNYHLRTYDSCYVGAATAEVMSVRGSLLLVKQNGCTGLVKKSWVVIQR